MGDLNGPVVSRNRDVDRRYLRNRKAPSEETKRKISETLTGQKFGGDYVIDEKAGKELRDAVKDGDNFKYQPLIDWWRDLKR